MDILKIRKKKARERKGEAPEPTDEGEAVAPSSAAEADARAPDDATRAPEPKEDAAAAGERPAVSASDDEELDDPLREFLARYDDGDEEEGVSALAEETAVGETKRFLAFELAGEAYAASIMDVREILRVVALTAVPRAPIQILGVVSKRGIVMPVIDLAATLSLRRPDRRYSATQRVLVVGDGARVCGLRVDRVLEVVRLRDDDIEEVPASLGARSAHQLRGLGRAGDRMFSLLDVQAVLDSLAVSAGIETKGDVS